MDLSSIEIPDTATIELEGPTGELLIGEDGSPCTVTVFGPASEQAVEYQRQSKQRILDRVGRKGVKGLKNLSVEESEQFELDRLVAFTAEVQGLTYKGDPITPGNIREVYANPRFGWLRNQVAARIGGWEDFLMS